MLPCFRQWLSIKIQHILSCESCIALLVKSKKKNMEVEKRLLMRHLGKPPESVCLTALVKIFN